jgi:hypothetical protein
VSKQQVGHDLSSEFGFGPALGNGPVYPLMGEMQGGVLRYAASYSQAHYKDGWAYSKVLWIAKPQVQGPLLIRGHQLDGPNAVGFSFGQADDPDMELMLMAPEHHGTTVWSDWPSATRIRGTGCYAYQVDDLKGSDTIVFRVVSAS